MGYLHPIPPAASVSTKRLANSGVPRVISRARHEGLVPGAEEMSSRVLAMCLYADEFCIDQRSSASMT